MQKVNVIAKLVVILSAVLLH